MAEEIKNTSGGVTPTNPEDEGTQEAKTFTQEELDAIAGKVRKEAKEAADKEAQEKINSAVAEAIKEAERKAKLSADEREKELLADQAKKNEERERNNTLRENRLDAIDALIDLEIPDPKIAAEFVVDLDKKVQAQKIEDFVSVLDKMAQSMVEKKLQGNTPDAVGEETGTQTTGVKKFEL